MKRITKALSTISSRVLAGVLIIVVAVVAITGIAEYDINIRQGTAELLKNGDMLASRLSHSLVYPLWEMDRYETEQVVAAETASQDVLAILVFYEQGALYAGKIKDAGGNVRSYNAQDPHDRSALAYAFRTVTRQVIKKETVIGVVSVYLTDKQLREDQNKIMLRLVLKLLILVAALSAGLYATLKWLIVRPIDALKSWVTMKSADYTVPPPRLKESEELNSLAFAFDDLTTALLKSEGRFETIFDSVNDAIFINDRESGAILDVNDVACEMYGYSREELLSVDIGTISSGESSYIQQDAVDKIAEVATGKPQLFEWKAKRKNGNLFWVEVNMKRAAIGGADAVVVVVRDITERKRAEAALRESQQRFQNAFEFAAIGMALVAPDGRWIRVNKSLCNLMGYQEDELLRKTFQDITHPDDLEADLALVRQMLTKEIRTYRREKRYIHKSGRIVWVSLSVSLIWKDEDNPLYFISQIEDITDRKQTEENLKKSEERLSKFFMMSPVGMTVSSLPDGRLLDINSEFETMLGFDRSEAVGKTTMELGIWLDPKDRENVLSRVRSEGKVRDLDLQIRAKQGNIVTQRFSAAPIEIDGRTYLLSAFADVTRQRKAEEELKQYHVHLEELVEERTSELSEANRKLKELDRLKSMFIASMSHELRTPLNSIIGFTGMTLQGMSGELNDEQKDNLTRAYHSAKHLLDLISDVIDISKIEAGRVEAYPEGFSLRKMVDDAVATVVPQLKDKALTIEVDVPPDTFLTTDRRRLLQCLINFLSNAVKFSESGRVIVASRKTDGLVSLSVSDTGIGIAGEDIHRLFEPFERLETRLRVKAGGTGLGLYLTKKLAIEVLRGDVSVESIEGQGSTFTITFPEDIGQTGKPSTDQGGGDIL